MAAAAATEITNNKETDDASKCISPMGDAIEQVGDRLTNGVTNASLEPAAKCKSEIAAERKVALTATRNEVTEAILLSHMDDSEHSDGSDSRPSSPATQAKIRYEAARLLNRATKLDRKNNTSSESEEDSEEEEDQAPKGIFSNSLAMAAAATAQRTKSKETADTSISGPQPPSGIAEMAAAAQTTNKETTGTNNSDPQSPLGSVAMAVIAAVQTTKNKEITDMSTDDPQPPSGIAAKSTAAAAERTEKETSAGTSGNDFQSPPGIATMAVAAAAQRTNSKETNYSSSISSHTDDTLTIGGTKVSREAEVKCTSEIAAKRKVALTATRNEVTEAILLSHTDDLENSGGSGTCPSSPATQAKIRYEAARLLNRATKSDRKSNTSTESKEDSEEKDDQAKKGILSSSFTAKQPQEMLKPLSRIAAMAAAAAAQRIKNKETTDTSTKNYHSPSIIAAVAAGPTPATTSTSTNIQNYAQAGIPAEPLPKFLLNDNLNFLKLILK